MPKPGYKTITVPETTFNRLEDLKKKLGFESLADLIYYLTTLPVLEPMKCEELRYWKFIRYPGSDTPILSKLLSLIPQHHSYVEVFGGSAVLLLAKEPSPIEVYNDIDKNLVNLFKVVKDDELFIRFLKELELILYSRQLFDEYKLRYSTEKDSVKRAAMFYYLINASINGLLRTFSTGKNRTTTLANTFFSMMKRLWCIHSRLRRVVIENLDFRECIRKYDAENTLFYLDPPYYNINEGRYYAHGFRKHDFLTLLKLLENIKGMFILKHYLTEELDEWIQRNKFYSVVVPYRATMNTSERRPKSSRQYVLVTNFPPRSP